MNLYKLPIGETQLGINKSILLKLTLSLLFVFILLSSVLAAPTNVVNSRDWSDVYSVLLASKLDETQAFFVNSESLVAATNYLNNEMEITVYDGQDAIYISNLGSQLRSAGFTVEDSVRDGDLGLALDPGVSTYYVISEDNYRTAISLLPVAIKQKAWVFIVDEDNVATVAERISAAGVTQVIGVGTFPRDTLSQLTEYFTEYINNENIYLDTHDVAKKFGDLSAVVLADGSTLESEFFTGRMPVILSGFNKVLDDTYNFLEDNKVENVIIVGSELSVVGEQIRTRSNKEISVFIKFGQSGSGQVGKIFSLSFFTLPTPQIGVAIDKAIYDASENKLFVTYKNVGNVGVYLLSTISVKNDDTQIGEGADSGVLFLGAGETFIQAYDMTLNVVDVAENTKVEFFTSFGAGASQLDSFITADDKFGPPFSLSLSLEDIGTDAAQLDLVGAAYYPDLKRVGVEVTNPTAETVYYNVKVNQLVVNGIATDLFKQDSVKPGTTKITYIPVVLDEIDVDENDEIKVTLVYGSDEEILLKAVSQNFAFELIRTGLSLIVWIIIVLVVVLAVAGIGFFIMARNDSGRSRRRR